MKTSTAWFKHCDDITAACWDDSFRTSAIVVAIGNRDHAALSLPDSAHRMLGGGAVVDVQAKLDPGILRCAGYHLWRFLAFMVRIDQQSRDHEAYRSTRNSYK